MEGRTHGKDIYMEETYQGRTCTQHAYGEDIHIKDIYDGIYIDIYIKETYTLRIHTAGHTLNIYTERTYKRKRYIYDIHTEGTYKRRRHIYKRDIHAEETYTQYLHGKNIYTDGHTHNIHIKGHIHKEIYIQHIHEGNIYMEGIYT